MQRKPMKRRGKLSLIVRLAIVAAVLVLIAPTLLGRIFAVRSIQVQGNSYRTADEVIATSGIELGENLLWINAGKVAANINADRYLEYVGIWRDYGSGNVTLTVSEHAPLAKMAWMGMLVLIGDDGVVLEKTASIHSAVHIPEIVGMTATQTRVGQPVQYSVAGQGDAIERLLSELKLQGVAGEVVEINVASPDNLFLVMENGLQVMLGGDNLLAQKLALVREVMPRAQAYGPVQGGVLDVSTGRMADYKAP